MNQLKTEFDFSFDPKDREELERNLRMTALCQSIPCLVGCAGVRHWSATTFAHCQAGRSRGEKLAASFVLTVWSGGKHGEWSYLPDFDLADVAAHCDRETKEAICKYIMEPFWP